MHRAQIESLGYSLLALVLVVVFVQTIGVWRWLSEELGKSGSTLVPFLVAAFLLMVVFVARLRKKEQSQFYWLYLVAALVLVGIALYLPDSRFPAKRIHVAEFMLLAFVLRRGFCRWSSGIPLIVMTAATGIVLGAHDELIQGLHPERYFGHRDIVVDGLSAIAGALAGHGLRLYDTVPKREENWIVPPWWALAAVAASLIVFLYLLPGLQETPLPQKAPLPWWTLTPLLIAAFVWSVLDRTPRSAGDPASIAAWLVFVMAFYPGVTHTPAAIFQ